MGEPMKTNEAEMATLFEKLRGELVLEAKELVSEVPSARVSILISPTPDSGSEASSYTFGDPSAEEVLKALLEHEDKQGKGKQPMLDEDEKPPMGWWNDTKKFESMTPQQLKAAHDQLIRLQNRLITLEKEASSSGNPEAED